MTTNITMPAVAGTPQRSPESQCRVNAGALAGNYGRADGEQVRVPDPDSVALDGTSVVPGKTALNNLRAMGETLATALLPDKTVQHALAGYRDGKGAAHVVFGMLEGIALDTLDLVKAPISLVKDGAEAAFWGTVAGARAVGKALHLPSAHPVQPTPTLCPPSIDQVHIRTKTESRTGYFDYALKDGRIWTKWNPILPTRPFTIPCAEAITEEEARDMLSEVPGPYTYTFDPRKNDIVVTPRPDADQLGFDMVAGRLTPADAREASAWHLHDRLGGPNLPPGEHIVEMQVSSEMIEVRTNKDQMYSYDPTKPGPVGWKADKGCPFGGDVHLPEGIKDWTFGLSVAIKPARPCLNALNPYTDIVSYFEDAVGRKGAFGFTATTGVLLGNGREVRYRDTGLPADFMRGFLTPHHGQFLGEKLAQAGSTWVVYGHDPDGAPGLYARMYDYEVNGDCPGKRYTYEDVPFDKDKVYSLNDMVEKLPEPGWNHIPFPPLSGQALVTDHFNILTTGHGDRQREIRLEGQNAAGITGFYHKQVDQPDWQFTATAQPLVGQPIPVGSPDPSKATPAPITWSYGQAKWSGDLAQAPLRSLELLDFHPYQTQDQPSTVRFTLDSGKTVDALVRTGDAWSMFQGRESDTEMAGAGVGLEKVLIGTLEVPESTRNSGDPEVKAFVDTYLMRMHHVENSIMLMADEEELRVVTGWYHRNSDERLDWTPNPHLEVTFSRDATGQTAYEKMALEATLSPNEQMSDGDLEDLIDRNTRLQSEIADDLHARQASHKLRWARSQVVGPLVTAASAVASALNVTGKVDHAGPITELLPPLLSANTKADWHAAWTTPAGYERAMETLRDHVTRAEAMLEGRREKQP